MRSVPYEHRTNTRQFFHHTMNHVTRENSVNAQAETVEQEIQRKGLNAPRVTPADIEAAILATQYWQPLGTTLVVCVITLQNGTPVTGESACASPANFDFELGSRIAREDAKRKIGALEGYLLRDKLSRVER